MEDNPQGPGQPVTPPPSQPTTPKEPPAQPPPPQEPPRPSGGAVSPNRTIMLILAYLWILALIPLLTEKEDRDVQWHSKHGIVLLVAEVVAWILMIIVTTIMAMVPVLGWILGCALPVALGVAILVVHIMSIVKAINGEQFRLPFVSDFADQWK